MTAELLFRLFDAADGFRYVMVTGIAVRNLGRNCPKLEQRLRAWYRFLLIGSFPTLAGVNLLANCEFSPFSGGVKRFFRIEVDLFTAVTTLRTAKTDCP